MPKESCTWPVCLDRCPQTVRWEAGKSTPRRIDLKVLPKFFEDLTTGLKNFELRYNDRDFQVGDILCLREWDDQTKQYSGNHRAREVTYVLHQGVPRGLEPGYVILGLRVPK